LCCDDRPSRGIHRVGTRAAEGFTQPPGGGSATRNRALQSFSAFPRLQLASKPKCRILTKPAGRTCRRKRRINSTTSNSAFTSSRVAVFFPAVETECVRRNFPGQGLGVENPNAQFIWTGARDFLLFDQEKLMEANVLGTELIGWFTKGLERTQRLRAGRSGWWWMSTGGSEDPPTCVGEVQS
jgi:hypothetical protein